MDLYGSLARLYDTTDDDPRLYKLVKKITDQGIDPNKWLEAKVSGGPAPAAERRDPRQDTSFARTGREGSKAPDEPIELAEPGLAAKALQGAVTPETRRQFLRGVSDTTTFGLAEKLGNLVDPGFAASAKGDAENSPNARMYGGVAGAVLPGGTAKLGQLAGKGIGALGKAGARLGGLAAEGGGSIVGGGLGGALGGAASVPLVSGVSEGLQAAVKGPVEDAPRAAWDGAKSAAKNPIAMALGTGLGALGGVATGVRSGNTRTGEDIRAVEEAGGKPGLFRGAKGGEFERAPLAGRRGTTSDVGEVAREAGDEIRGGLNKRMDAVQQRYGEGLERIKRDELVATPSRRRAVPSKVDDFTTYEGTPSAHPDKFERIPGASADPAGRWPYLENPTRVAKDPNWKLEGQTSRPVEGPTTGPGPGALSTEPVRAAAEKLLQSERLSKAARNEIKAEVIDALAEKPTMSVEQMNEFRGKLQDLAKYGENTSKPHFKALHREAKRIVDQTDFGQVNSDYSKGIEASKRAHRQLGLGKNVSRTDIEDPVAGKKLARVVRRQEENTATAGQESVDVERFVKENPEFARLLQSSKLMAAKGRLRAGFPENGGLYEKLSGLAGRNVEPLLGGVVYPIGSAVGGRGAAQAPTAMIQLQEALEESRRKNEERAAMYGR